MSDEKSLFDRVEEALDLIRPYLISDGGNVDLVDVSEDGIVSVRLKGACAGCPASTMTLKAGIENTLKERVPEVSRVESVM